jgi:hypothetical protein
VQDRALDHALEPGGGLGIGLVVGFERLVFLIEILPHRRAELGDLDAAGQHHLFGVLVLDQRQQQMFERGVFMPPFGGIGERLVESLFEILRKAGHSISFADLGALQDRRRERGKGLGRQIRPRLYHDSEYGEFCGNFESPHDGFAIVQSFLPNSASAAARCAAAASR